MCRAWVGRARPPAETESPGRSAFVARAPMLAAAATRQQGAGVVAPLRARPPSGRSRADSSSPRDAPPPPLPDRPGRPAALSSLVRARDDDDVRDHKPARALAR